MEAAATRFSVKNNSLQPAILLKKATVEVLSCECFGIPKSTFLTRHLWATAVELINKKFLLLIWFSICLAYLLNHFGHIISSPSLNYINTNCHI